MKRERIFSAYQDQDFAVVSIPVGDEGKEARAYLRRQQLVGECQLAFTGNTEKHEDRLVYESVVIISTHREAPEAIAVMAQKYFSDGAIGVPCTSCRGAGCRDCGFLGVQA